MAQRADTIRDLLFALLALRERGSRPARIRAALDAWLEDSGRPMAELLVERGALDGESSSRLEALVTERLARLDADQEEDSRRVRQTQPDDPEALETIAYVGPSPGGPEAEGPQHAIDPGAGRYRVLRPHASGGLGEVFVALDSELNREVALKELRDHLAFDPASQSRFLLEAEITGRLEHPGIVPVYGLGRHADGRPYYAMRLIGGETLGEAIGRFHGSEGQAKSPADREIAFRRLLRVVIDACNAVAYAHSRGVVHRDLKPENIMLGPFGETLVLDWGIAKALSGTAIGVETDGGTPIRGPEEDASTTRPGAIVGTPRYMSPEQAEGDLARVGPASDVYGLGATLYCVLVGHAPFPDGDVPTILERVRRGIFPSPRKRKKTADPALEAICLKAMSREPADRHPSPLALAGEIEAWLADVRYRVEQEKALGQARRSLARLGLERAHNLFARGRHAEGMLWLSRVLDDVSADDPALDRAVRSSLAGWHGRDRLLERSLSHDGEVCLIAFSPGGSTLATACGRWARLWDISTGAALAAPLRHAGPVRALAFSPDGKSLATAGDDGGLSRWDALTGAPLGPPAPVGGPIATLAFSPDGSRLAAASTTGTPCLWDTASGSPIPGPCAPGASILALAFHPRGDLLAASCDDGQVHLWEVATGRPLGEPLRHDSAVPALAFSPDGRRLLTGCRDGKARLWDLSRREPSSELPHSAEVGLVRFGPDGDVVATASHDGTARLWDASTGAPIGEPLEHRGRVDGLAFAPDRSSVATCGLDGTARLWDASTALPIGPPYDHRGPVSSLAFSPDGRRLATACSDGVARCWKILPPLPGAPERIACWIRVQTGLEFDPGDAIRPASGHSTWDLRRRLHELGGPPIR